MRLLVRHAHAGDKRYWSGPDAERPLSIRGWVQAQGLPETLAGFRVERLLTSPWLRCRQTLLPLAAALDLDLEAVEDLGIDGDVDRLVELVAAADSDGAVLCTHGEVLGELLARLGTRGERPRGDVAAQGRLGCEKGATWVLEQAAGGRFHARYLPPPAPPPEQRWWWQGSVRAELGRLAVEQQRLLGTIAALTTTTQQLAAGLGPRLAALTAEHAALSQLDQVREGARALADTHARLVQTHRRVLGGLLPAGAQPAPPAGMVAGLTDAGAVLTTAGNQPTRHATRRWVVLAEQPLAVRAEPAQVERLMLALLEAADAALPPAAPTWVVARATTAGAVVAIATDPASLPLDGRQPAAGRHLQPLPRHQAGATAVGQAGQLAERLGGELTIATGEAATARRLLLRFPLAALPDEVWPDQSPFPPTDAPLGVSHN